MVLPSPKAWHSTSSSTIAATADNRNSQLPSIWHQRMTGLPAAIGYARDHIAEGLTVERLAEEIGMSLRQFSRAFRAQTGTTPARVVERLRVDLARGRIETTAEPVEHIAEAVGFGDAENMRRAFIRIYGQPPQSIRRAIKR